MRTFLICGIAILLVGSLYAQPQAKPIKRPKNNELAIEGPVPGTGREAETPAAVSAAVDRLMFHVSPLQTQGLLSEQLREALKFLIKANGNATFVKLRAFVAGTGDLRRVPAIVAEMFAEKKLALPAVTTVRVGGFGLDNAQVVIESVSEAKKPGANGAVKFLYGNEAATGTEAVARLEDAMRFAGVKSPATDTLRMTCFVNAREQIEPMRVAASRVFGKAESVFVQSSRFAAGSAASCEGIARAPSGVSGRVIFTAPQMIFGEQDSDTQLGWDRLKKSVVLAGGDADHLLEVNVYTTSGISEKTNAAIKNVSQRNAMVRLFEALPSEDALMAIEVVASAK